TPWCSPSPSTSPPASSDRAMTEAEFVTLVQQNPINRLILERLPALGLDGAYLTAGCLFQAVWNHRTGQPMAANVNDYDVFYHDSSDLSWEAEDRIIRKAAVAFADLDARIEVKNQARVHLWYHDRFGSSCPALESAEDGIGRFPVRGTCVGLQATTNRLFAPFGLDDIAEGLLRPNPAVPLTARFTAKARSYQARWPHLRILPL
ncbi:nucleotidyltransferase family protein, partial [Acidiphilium sp.]|uniref:nucleotidyltransferase family protein n=1 Tax=Acidiphilium sp. TaxID=527 RepID=UPI003CFC6156